MTVTAPPVSAAPLEVLDGDDRKLLRALQHAERSRAELSQSTGWSRNTVATKLDKLLTTGWVLENADTPIGRGRPSSSYKLNALASLNFVARFNAEQVGAAICSLDRCSPGRLGTCRPNRGPTARSGRWTRCSRA